MLVLCNAGIAETRRVSAFLVWFWDDRFKTDTVSVVLLLCNAGIAETRHVAVFLIWYLDNRVLNRFLALDIERFIAVVYYRFSMCLIWVSYLKTKIMMCCNGNSEMYSKNSVVVYLLSFCSFSSRTLNFTILLEVSKTSSVTYKQSFFSCKRYRPVLRCKINLYSYTKYCCALHIFAIFVFL